MKEAIKKSLSSRPFLPDTSIYTVNEVKRALSKFKRKTGYILRRDCFKNANIVVYNPAKMSGSDIYNNPNELRNMINDASARIRELNGGLLSRFDGRYAVIVRIIISLND